MTRPSRLEQLHAHASRLSAAAGARNGAVLATAAATQTDGQTSAELWLYGIVGAYWFGFSDKTVADQLRGLEVDNITVRINSPGGDSIQGIAIGNLLRNHKATVTVVVDGLAASAASIIAIAGDKVVMSPGSQMMVHDPWFFTIGNEKQLRQDADFLGKQGANMAGVYALEAGGTPEAWREAMTAEPDGTWYTADEAVAAHLADEVGTVVAISAAPEPPPVDLTAEDDVAARAAWDLEVLIAPAARTAWQAHMPAPKPPAAPAPGSPEKEETAVAFTDAQLADLRTELKLPDDANEDQILAAVRAAAAPGAGGNQQVPNGQVLVDQETWATTQAQAAEGAVARKAQIEAHRTAVLDSAIRKGKFPSSRREHYESLLKADPEGSEALIDSLAEGTVPLTEVGHDDGTKAADLDGVNDVALSGLEAGFGIPAGMLKGVPA